MNLIYKIVFTVFCFALSDLGYSQVFTIGTGTSSNTSTSYPAPYGQYYNGAKHQMLIKATELTSAGITTQRMIQNMAFNVGTPAGASLLNFTIKIGMTTATSLSTTYLTGLTTVFSTSSYTSVSGWNTHAFSTPFTWDGTSNLVVEVCFDNYPNGYTTNATTYYTSTSFTSCTYYYSDAGSVCPHTSCSSTTSRPNMRFLITTPVAYDVVMNQVLSPSSWAVGNNTLTVQVANYGTTALSSADFGYQLSGSSAVLQNAVSISPSKTTGQTYNHTYSTALNIPSAGTYTLKIWARNPNGTGPDGNTANDTVTQSICTGISGSYTIDPNGSGVANYISFNDAVTALNNCGISGPVKFTIAPGTYNEKITLGNITGASATNTITFDGVDSASRKITFNQSGSASNPAVINLAGTNYVTFKNLGITATGTSTCIGVNIQSGSGNNNFLLCNIRVSETLTTSTCFGIGICGSTYSSASNAGNNLIQNCTIIGGYMNVVMYGLSSAPYTQGNRLKNCILLNAYQYGLYFYYQNYDTILDNQLTMRTSTTSGYGLYSYYNQNNRIERNILNNIPYMGMYIYNNNNIGSGRISVSNNIINMNAITPYSTTQYGLYALYNVNIDILHNTVYMANVNTTYTAYISYGSGQVVKNNIFHTLSTGSGGYAIYVPSTSGFTAFDHNILYSSSPTVFAYWAGAKADYASLKASSAPYNQNSKVTVANFVSLASKAEDLHLTSTVPAEYGDAAYTTATDVDGDARCTFAATIGADESTYGAGPPTAAFTAPDSIFINSPTTLFNNSPALAPLGHKWYINAALVSTQFNLSYTFTTSTVYLIKLVTVGCFGIDSVTKLVTVYNPSVRPVANFISDFNITETYQPVQFTDLSTKGPTFWYWTVSPATGVNFNNGTNNNSQNPSISFSTPGLYSVCLQDSNMIGMSTAHCKTNYILVKATSQMCIYPFDTRISTGTLYDDGGPSGNYGANHTASNPCSFLIDPCASSVNLVFSEFNLGTGALLKVYDGRDKFGIPLHTGTGFTGTTIPGGTLGLTAASGKMYIEFVTASTLAPGFKASWTSIAGSYTPPTGNIIAPDTAYDCGGLFNLSFHSTNPSFINDEAYYKWYFDYANNNAFPDAEGRGFSSVQWSYGSVGPYIIRLDIEGCGGTLTLYDTIIVATTPGKPVVDFTADYTSGSTNDVITLTDISKYGPTWWKWKISGPGNTTIVSGTLASKIVAVRFPTVGLYTVQLIDSNCIGSDSLTKTAFINIINYCTPSVSTLNPDFAIQRVTMGRVDTLINGTITGFDYLNNSPAVGTTIYRNNSDQLRSYYIGSSSITKKVEAIVSLGASINFNIVRPTNYNPFNVNVWVDYDQDGTFSASEQVASSGVLSGTTFSGSFTIPTSAVLGYTRIRIGTAFANLSNTPCGTNQFGEFNDYRIKITPDITVPVITFNGSDTITVEVGRIFTDPGFTVTDDVTNPTPYTVTGMASGTQITVYPFSSSYTITATDGSGNSSTRTRIINAGPDITKPVITLNGSAITSVEVKTNYSDSGATATDFFFGNFTPNISTTSNVNINIPGTYSVTYNVTDSSGNAAIPVVRTVIVKDTQKPVITITGGNTVYVNVFNTFTPPLASVTDNYDNSINYTVTGQAVNTNIVGTYYLYYNATDSSGNAAVTQTLTVIVRDITPPVLKLFGRDTFIVDVKTLNSVPEPGYSLSDNYYLNGALSLKVDYSNVDLNTIGIYPVRYYLSDPSGNIDSSKVRYYNVTDRIAPIIALNGANYMTWPRWKPFVDPGATVTDNYYNGLSATVDLSQLNIYLNGVYEIKYAAIDPSGNKAAAVTRLVQIYTLANGIDRKENDDMFSLYPNPNNGVVTIDLHTTGKESTVIEVFDASGRKVYSKENGIVQGNKIQIDMNNEADGIYYVQVISGNLTASKTFTVRK